jgi:predicted nuclease with RNAse H fold
MIIVGLDLAGVHSRPTGLCILRDVKAETFLVHEDGEIIGRIEEIRPDLIAVDAPLSLPEGRASIEERTDVHLRECDVDLLKRGIKFFPVTLGPMRKLTGRGIRLREVLEGKGFKVVEVYPGGAQDVLKIPRKQRGLESLRKGLEKLGIEGLTEGLSDHELDAATCAYVGRLFMEGKAVVYGTTERAIIMPAE